MANKKFIKTFESYRNTKSGVAKANESVKQIDDIYKVGNINVPQSLINSYVKKVKEETKKNLRQLYSDMEIAEELVKYSVDTHLNSDDIPVSALLGGAIEDEDFDTDVDEFDTDELGDDLDLDTETEEVSTEDEEPLEELDMESEGEESADDDLDLDDDLDDEFSEPVEGEEGDVEFPEDLDEEEEEEEASDDEVESLEDEENDLPI